MPTRHDIAIVVTYQGIDTFVFRQNDRVYVCLIGSGHDMFSKLTQEITTETGKLHIAFTTEVDFRSTFTVYYVSLHRSRDLLWCML